MLAGSVLAHAPSAAAQGTNLALGKPATASSSENATFPASAAVDGNSGTRWSSAFSDPQWLQVDLGSAASISRVRLSWEAAYATAYQVQVSPNATSWSTIATVSGGDGGVDDLAITGSGRYVRIYTTARATAYGASLWELEVYGTSASPTATPTPPASTPTPQPTSAATPTPAPTSGACGSANMAAGRPASASSVENASLTASAAVDGSAATRWASTFSDPQWLQVDLGVAQPICRVRLSWEAAYAKAYQVQTSNDAASWTTIANVTGGDGGVDDLTVSGSGRYVRVYATARATEYGYSLWELEVYSPSGTPPAPTPTPTGGTAFWGDTSGIPAANNVLTVKFLNRTNGKYADKDVYWSYNGQVHSIAEQPYFDMPANTAGRMYVYLGSPNSQYNDFIEFTVGPNTFNGNTTRVDWFGVKLAMRLHAKDGYDVAVGEDLATFQEDRAVTFQKFIDEVPAEFKHLAQIQAPYRIPAPGKMGETDFLPGGQYANYFTSYASSVGVTGASVFDIFACAGVLRENAAMCSALNRHVAHLPQSQWGDASQYYKAGPANYYAKFWHDHSLNAMAYGFPYDDYAGYSSFISHDNPQYLLLAIGW
ncbi:coagulation factor 5/8 type domain-containing protein [Chloroflexia bacterium SDU3-3]|nr:coagulation factor 5/8 type domain-containing protein [Chloroflexia bacterium SDU3-3]